MPPKKGKKGKMGKKEASSRPVPVTTVQIISDRTKMLCPRLGDIYTRTLNAEGILEEVVDGYLNKAVEKQSDSLSLIAMKMKRLPDISAQATQLLCLTNLNLSKNNLFNGDELFQALAALENITTLNLSENFLNGMLSDYAGKLANLETLNMDINNITMLCTSVQYWVKLKVFTMSDNSLTGKGAEQGPTPPLLYALCQQVICVMRYALCVMRYASCVMRHASCVMRHAVCRMHYATRHWVSH
jgi:hypothetical protein